MENTGGQNKQKKLAKTKGYQALVVVDKCTEYQRKSTDVKRMYRTVFLNRWAAARYRALASFIPGRQRFSWKCHFSFLSIFHE